jgi:helicase
MSEGPKDLFPPQQELLAAGFRESRDHWLICAPTGSGKTRVGEWAIEDALAHGYRAAYIAPLRAIVEEKYAEWQVRFGTPRVGLFTGDAKRDSRDRAPAGQCLLLFTPEKLASYIQNWRRHLAWLSEVDVLVIDEFHLLGDRNRGATIECLLNRAQRINPFLRIIGLSGTVSNHEEIATWLGARVYLSRWRPIPLEHRVCHFKRATDKPQLLLEECQQTLADGGKVLAFVNSRRRAEQLAHFLQEQHIDATFSHAGLESSRRQAIHERMRTGNTDVLVATSTVEMGVNFPARKVVIVDSWAFDGEVFSPVTVQRYQQFAGRAGRPGLDPHGECVLFTPSWEREKINYATATPERLKSALFSTDNLLREILYEVAGRLSITDRHLETNFAKRSFWRLQGGTASMHLYLRNLVLEGLLQEREKHSELYLSCTPLGRVATQMLVSPRTVILLANTLNHIPKASNLDLLIAVCLCPEVTPKLGFNFEEVDGLSDTILTVESLLLDRQPEQVRQIGTGITERSLLSALKCATLLHRHAGLEALEDLAAQFDCYPADLATLKGNAIWVLETAQRVFGVLLDANHKEQANEAPLAANAGVQRERNLIEHRCEQLRLMLEHGIPEEALELVAIPRIGSRRARHLCEHGIHTAGEVATMLPRDLNEIFACGERIAYQIIEAAKVVAGNSESCYTTTPPTTFARTSAHPAKASIDWPAGIDPYRLRRALELRVTHASPVAVHVQGGTEPHVVRIEEIAGRERSYQCDCLDFAKGTPNCKHVLRARLANHDDRKIRPLLERLADRSRKPLRHALADLWLKAGREYDVFNDRLSDRQPSIAGHSIATQKRKRR